MPETWFNTELGAVIKLQRGYDLPERLRRPGDVPILGSFGITGWHNEAQVKGPGVALGRSGGSMGVATYSLPDFWPLNTALFVKDFCGNDERYVYYLLKSIDFTGYNSGSVQPMLNRNYVQRIPVVLPPLIDQRAISEVLGALDDKAVMASGIAQKSELLATAIAAQVSGTTTIGDLAVIRRKTVSPSNFAGQLVEHFSLPAFDASRFPVTENGNEIKSGKSLLEAPTVLVSKLNPHIPRVWMAAPTQGMTAVTSTEFIGLVPKPQDVAEVLWALCNSEAFAAQVGERVKGTTGSHQRVAPEDVLKIEVPDPGLLTAGETAAIINSVHLADAERRDAARMTRFRESLMPRLISGEVRVRDAEELVGAAL